VNAATTKLAQVATGSRTCSACGKTKMLDRFELHPRWKTPMSVCDSCMAAKRKAGAVKRLKSPYYQNKRKAKAEADRVAAANREAAKLDSSTKGILFAKLEGYAMAVNDGGALAKLVAELRKATHV